MKTIYSLLLFALLLLNTKANSQNLGINYVNYSNGQIITSGNILTKFIVTNYGSSVLNTGDTVYVGARIQGTYYDLQLYTQGGSTPIVLSANLGVNGTFTDDPGYLTGSSLLSYYNTTSVEVCVVVYGKGKNSVNTSFPTDPVPANNIACVTYNESGSPTTVVQEIATASNNELISVYPNPTVNEINFKFSKAIAGKIIISDLTGKTVKEFETNNTLETIDVGDLKKGIYFYTICEKLAKRMLGKIIVN